MADLEPNNAPPALPDFPINPLKGYWEDVTFQECLYVNVNVTAGSKNQVYYLPVEFPQSIISEDKMRAVADGLFYTPKEINWSISDLRAEADVKTLGEGNAQIALNDMGFRVYDTENDMTVSDRLYPYAHPDDHDIMENLIKNSKQRLFSPPPKCLLFKNNFKLMSDAGNEDYWSNEVNPRDPNFMEKNNAAEEVVFAGQWINDIGLRIPTAYMFLPRQTVRPYCLSKYDPVKGLHTGLTTADAIKAATVNVNCITIPRGDYMYGQQTSPYCHISDVQQLAADSQKLDRAFYNRTMYPGHDGGTQNYGTVGAPIIYPIQSGPLPYNFNLSLIDAPYSADGLNRPKFKSNEELDVLIGRANLYEKFNPYSNGPGIINKSISFSGNKSIKPLYFELDPKPFGTTIMPYNVYFKFNYEYTVQVYKKQASMEAFNFMKGPEKWPMTNVGFMFGADVLYQEAKMLNIFQKENTEDMYLENSYNKFYMPHVPIMFRNIVDGEVMEIEEPPSKKQKI